MALSATFGKKNKLNMLKVISLLGHYSPGHFSTDDSVLTIQSESFQSDYDSVLDNSVQDDSVRDDSVQDVSVPDSSVQDVSVQTIQSQNISVPKNSVQDFSVPKNSVQDNSVPRQLSPKRFNPE